MPQWTSELDLVLEPMRPVRQSQALESHRAGLTSECLRGGSGSPGWFLRSQRSCLRLGTVMAALPSEHLLLSRNASPQHSEEGRALWRGPSSLLSPRGSPAAPCCLLRALPTCETHDAESARATCRQAPGTMGAVAPRHSRVGTLPSPGWLLKVCYLFRHLSVQHTLFYDISACLVHPESSLWL